VLTVPLSLHSFFLLLLLLFRAQVGNALKKNNVAVSVVMLGELEANVEKMEAFVAKVNSNDNSHLVQVPAGVVPSDAIRTSLIMGDQMLTGDAGMGGGGGGDGGMFAEYGGIDPSMDPELAEAMRASAMEYREAEEARAQSEAPAAAAATATGDASDAAATGTDTVVVGAGDLTDEQAVELAARISLESPVYPPPAATTGDGGDGVAVDEDDEDAALARAIALSMADSAEEDKATAPPAPPGDQNRAADRDLGKPLTRLEYYLK
jgi:26S proteasome regulatory subunit N10